LGKGIRHMDALPRGRSLLGFNEAIELSQLAVQ